MPSQTQDLVPEIDTLLFRVWNHDMHRSVLFGQRICLWVLQSQHRQQQRKMTLQTCTQLHCIDHGAGTTTQLLCLCPAYAHTCLLPILKLTFQLPFQRCSHFRFDHF